MGVETALEFPCGYAAVLHPTSRSGHVSLYTHLSNDLRPWLVDTVDCSVDFPILF
jgi:hypothetical protein